MKKGRRSIRIASLLFLVALLLAVPLVAVACGGKKGGVVESTPR
mgnify:CR=1 FL=1